MIIRIIFFVILTIISACLYRAGGMAKEETARPKWIPKGIRNTKARDFGVPLCAVLSLIVLGYLHWTLILVFGMMFGSMTTYWKRKHTDATWFSWVLTGFFYGVSVLPVVIAYGLWVGFTCRVIATSIFVMAWSLFIGNDVVEEMGRGAINNITLAFLLIGGL